MTWTLACYEYAAWWSVSLHGQRLNLHRQASFLCHPPIHVPGIPCYEYPDVDP